MYSFTGRQNYTRLKESLFYYFFFWGGGGGGGGGEAIKMVANLFTAYLKSP